MKRAATRAIGLVAIVVAGCRGREETASPAGAPVDHSKKSPSSSLSLPFAALSFDEALARARAEKKLVFVDLTADWCSWCAKMDSEVFADPRVKTALRAYVPIQLDTGRTGGRSVASRYRVDGLPTFLVLGAGGEVVGRFDGYLPVDAFLLKLGRAAGGSG